MTDLGGSHNMGVVFSFDLNSKSFAKLKDFDGRNGDNPVYSSLLESKCIAPTALIPDAMVLEKGVEKNTVYIGYSPASLITLTAQVTGGNDSYSYQWSNGATTKSIQVNPTQSTTYTVSIKSNGGCSSTISKEVKVVDVRCGNKMDKVMVCKMPAGNPANKHTLCADPGAVGNHLNTGSYLGNCGPVQEGGLAINATPNPSATSFGLTIKSKNEKSKIMLTVSNAMGRVLEVKTVGAGQTIQLGASYPIGILYVEAVQGKEKSSIKLIKTNK
jgi:hypothetical protein